MAGTRAWQVIPRLERALPQGAYCLPDKASTEGRYSFTALSPRRKGLRTIRKIDERLKGRKASKGQDS